MEKKESAYWSATLKLLSSILAVWLIVSFGVSIIFVETFNKIKLGGYPLGFWFSQQGSIYIYIALIFIYARIMARIDRKYDVHEE